MQRRSRIMQTTSVEVLLAFLIFAGSIGCQGQVYSQGVTGGPLIVVRVDEHVWTIGSWPSCYGLTQFRSRTAEATPWIRRPTIHLGSGQITTRMPAVVVVSVAF